MAEAERTENVGNGPDGEAVPRVSEAGPADGTSGSSSVQNPQTPAFRFYIRSSGREMGVADMAELQKLYHLGFLEPEDDVRRAGTDIWRKAGVMPELKAAAPKPWLEGNEFVVLAVVICAATLLMIWLFG